MSKEILLTQGKVALVDDDDYERVRKLRWCASRRKAGKWYAYHSFRRNGEVRHLLLHRFILGTPPDVQVDHKNNDGLDCRHKNMRRATDAQNRYNKAVRSISASGFKGVWFDKIKRTWRARIAKDRRRFNLGHFGSPMDAALAYDSKARELFGEFAWLNFPETPKEQGAR